VGQGLQRLFQVPHGFLVSGPSQRFVPRLPAVLQGFVPYLAPDGVLGQAVYLLVLPVAGQRFERFDNLGVQHPPPL
jgi:hypothetical protein